jgi:hypothetical protein
MTTPLTTEIPQQLEPVIHDPFIDDLDALFVPVPPVRTGRLARADEPQPVQ